MDGSREGQKKPILYAHELQEILSHGPICQEGERVHAVSSLFTMLNSVKPKTHRATRGPEGLQCAVNSFAENRSLVSFLRSKPRDEGAACSFELLMHSRKV